MKLDALRDAARSPQNVALGALTALELAFHLVTCSWYARFSDELYIIALSRQLDWGYVDVMPLPPLLLRLSHALLGQSLLAERLLPAVAGAGVVLLTGLMARRLGGGALSQTIAALSALLAPAYLRASGVQGIKSYEPLLWALASHITLRILQRERAEGRSAGDLSWVALGVVLGLGVHNKPTMLLFAVACAGGLLLTPARRCLLRRGPWLAVGAAALVLLPNVVWQVQNGWPSVGFLATRPADSFSLKRFWLLQVLAMLPSGVLIGLLGVHWLLRKPEAAAVRALGWIFPIAALALIVTKGKSYYILPAYPVVLAAGGVAVEQWRPRWAKGLVVAATCLFGLQLLPVSLPLLRPDRLHAYIERGLPPMVRKAFRWEAEMWFQTAPLRQWEAERVADAFSRLSAEDQRRTAILCRGYPTASAVDFYGPSRGLPPAISPDQHYWMGGTRGYTGESVLAVDFDEEDIRARFGECERSTHAFTDVHGMDVFLCRRPAASLEAMWPGLRTFGDSRSKILGVSVADHH